MKKMEATSIPHLIKMVMLAGGGAQRAVADTTVS
jgi:hypothetical protein